jgi:hypothetical protein
VGLRTSIERIEPGGILRFRLAELPLAELLLTVHTSRFTGSIAIGDHPADHVFLRDGGVVGVTPKRHLQAQLLGEVLVHARALDRETLDQVLAEDDLSDGQLFGQRLLHHQMITAEDLDRACAEQARRRLFSLYDEHTDAPVLLCEGMKRLASFQPTQVDVRPAIAFGMVVRGERRRKDEVARRVANRTVRLAAPYDEQRNSYGLPPAVLQGIRGMSSGEMTLDDPPKLPGLGAEETAGVLLLFDRMSLLEIVS